MKSIARGSLLLIPTNLSDGVCPDTFLPREVIASALKLDFYIAENAKTARAFLKSLGTARPLQEISIRELNKHTGKDQLTELLQPLFEGHDMGLVSEAGAPAIADPGAEIVAFAHQRHINVMPLVGPSSILLGLMASGLNGQRFAFHGYLAQEKSARVLMLVENAARRMVTAISSVTLRIAFRITSNVTGSITEGASDDAGVLGADISTGSRFSVVAGE